MQGARDDMQMMKPVVVTIDTAGDGLSVALTRPDGAAFERVLTVGNRHAEHLFTLLDELLESAGVSKREIGLVGFGAGPGGFTGLRVACGVAQGLAWALGCRTAGVCNLEALAARAVRCEGLASGAVLAILNDARMNECYGAAYRVTPEGGLEVLCTPSLVKPEAVPAWLAALSPDRLCGNAAAAYETPPGAWGRVARFTQPVTALDMAPLALALHRRGLSVEPALAAPLYVRDRVALTAGERAAGEKL